MKSKLSKWLLAVCVAISLVGFTTSSEAYWHNGHHYYHHHYYHNNGYRHYGSHCRWIGGYWAYGYWHSARRVCTY